MSEIFWYFCWTPNVLISLLSLIRSAFFKHETAFDWLVSRMDPMCFLPIYSFFVDVCDVSENGLLQNEDSVPREMDCFSLAILAKRPTAFSDLSILGIALRSMTRNIKLRRSGWPTMRFECQRTPRTSGRVMIGWLDQRDPPRFLLIYPKHCVTYNIAIQTTKGCKTRGQ